MVLSLISSGQQDNVAETTDLNCDVSSAEQPAYSARIHKEEMALGCSWSMESHTLEVVA